MTAGTRRLPHLPLLMAIMSAAIAFVVSGCLWGVVRDSETGNGIGGVTVTYTDSNGNTATAMTESHGLYSFDSAAGPIPSLGPISFEVSKPGYETLTAARTIRYDDNPGATLENLSSFWDVQHFDLVAAAAASVIDTLASSLNFPAGVVYDSEGNLYVSERDSCLVTKIAADTGTKTTIAGTGVCGYTGDGGPATAAEINLPTGLALDRDRYLAIANTGDCRIRMVDLDTNFITTVAGNGGCAFSGDGGPATSAALGLSDVAVPSLFVWSDVAYDEHGNLYIADVFNCRVRKVDTHGTISTVAGSGATGFPCGSFAGDGGPATSARLSSPVAVAVDEDDNIFVAETGNCRVRKVNGHTGNISTVAGNGTCASSGDGGPATAASLAQPRGLAMDAAGNLYISELMFVPVPNPVSCDVRRVDAATGEIETVAGTGTCGFGGDSGPATAAQIDTPADIALSCDGDMAFAETLGGRVRVVSNVSSGGPAPDSDGDGTGNMCE